MIKKRRNIKKEKLKEKLLNEQQGFIVGNALIILPLIFTFAWSVIDSVAFGLWSVIRTPRPFSSEIFLIFSLLAYIYIIYMPIFFILKI